MAYQAIGLGTSAGDGTGDSIRAGGDKVNDNFVEIYTLLGTGTALSSGISATATVVTLASPVITGVVAIADGSASAPSFTNSGDTNTGIYFSAADTVSVTTGGTLRTTVNSTGLSVAGAFLPTAADGGALGSATLEWSDLFLADSSVINLGADQDVTLTHVHNTGVLLNSTMAIQFGDSGTYIHQSADGVLDLVSDTELELNATTIDINGNVEVSGTLAQVGVATFTGRDIHSGGITIANAGQIGSVGDADAIAIASDGVVTFTQVPVFPANSVNTQHYVDDSIEEAHMANDAISSVELKTLSTLLIKDSSGSTLATFHTAGA